MNCRIAYFFTFLVLLVIYIPVDLYLYRMVTNNFNAKFPNGLPPPVVASVEDLDEPSEIQVKAKDVNWLR